MKPRSDADLIEAIRILQSPAYRGLSRFHTEQLAKLLAEAKSRKLKV